MDLKKGESKGNIEVIARDNNIQCKDKEDTGNVKIDDTPTYTTSNTTACEDNNSTPPPPKIKVKGKSESRIEAIQHIAACGIEIIKYLSKDSQQQQQQQTSSEEKDGADIVNKEDSTTTITTTSSSHADDGMEAIQSIATCGMKVLKCLGEEKALKGVVDNWKLLVGGLQRSPEFKEAVSIISQFSVELKETTEFVRLLVKINKLVRILIKDKYKILRGKGGSSLKSSNIDKETLIADLRRLLELLPKSSVWTKAIQKMAPSTALLLSNTEAGEGNIVGTLKKVLGTDMEPIINCTKNVLHDFIVKNVQIIMDMRNSLLMVMENPNLLDDPQYQEKVKSLYKKVDIALRSFTGNPNIERPTLISSGKGLKKLSEPPTCNRIQETKQIIEDVRSISISKTASKENIKDLRDNIVTILLDQLSSIMIPEINEIIITTLGKFRYTVSGISLLGLSVKPKHINLEVSHKTGWNTRQTFLTIDIEYIQIHFKAVHWAYKRLSKPKLADSGVVNVDTGKKGMKIHMKVRLESQDQVVDDAKAECKIDKLKISVGDSKHDLLYGILTGLFRNIIKEQVEIAVTCELLALSKKLNEKFLEFLSYMKAKNEKQA